MNSAAPDLERDAAAGQYRGAKGREYHEGKRALAPAAEKWVHRLRAEKFEHWIHAGDVVFEFGVGSGWNLAGLKCARKIGCDAATFLAARVRAWGIEFIEDSRVVPDATADVVICHQTLEHVLDPACVLRELGRIVRPRGRLVAHVPWEVERRYARHDPREPNHHLYHWNAQNFGNLLTVVGWQPEVIRVRRYGYDRFAANLAVRLRTGETGFRVLRRMLVTLRPLREVECIAVWTGSVQAT